MYEVSEDYREALRKNIIQDTIGGTITLSDGTEIELSDRALMRNSLKITHELCGEFKVGTFNLGCLQMTVFDDDALLHDFSGAVIEPVYRIDTGGGWENVPLGIYIADGKSVRRKRDAVSLTAYDRGILFDKVIPPGIKEEPEGTPAGFISLACAECGVELISVHSGLPNGDASVSLASRQIQTYRDLVAWCAALMCAYAVIDRGGGLRIIPAKYSVDAQDSSSITVNKLVTEKERHSIYATDTRAYIKTLHAFCRGGLRTYVSDTVQEDEQAAEAVYTLSDNPLLASLEEEEEFDRIYGSWLDYIDGFKQRGVTAEIYGDPALDVGDVIRCSGGDIDQRKSIVGMVTKQEWRYRNFHTVICAAPQLNFSRESPTLSQYEKAGIKNDYKGGSGIKVAGNKVAVRLAENGGLAFNQNGELYALSGGTGGREIKFFTAVFNFYDVFDVQVGSETYKAPILNTGRYRPRFVAVTEDQDIWYNKDLVDIVTESKVGDLVARRRVWLSGTESGNNYGWGRVIDWILITTQVMELTEQPYTNEWKIYFRVPYRLTPTQRNLWEYFHAYRYRCFAICEA